MTSRFIKIKTNRAVYTCFIGPTLSYVAETTYDKVAWPLKKWTEENKEMIMVFERKIWRNIFGDIQIDNI